MTKAFKTRAVIGAYSGICPEGGFAQVHDVLNYLYPGVCRDCLPELLHSGSIQSELEKQEPRFKEFTEKFGHLTTSDRRDYFKQADEFFGERINLLESTSGSIN